MVALRTPGTGCPWDVEQTHESIAPYAIEEAYEVVDAIARGDREDLKDELGDLLLQVVFHARMAEEDGAFAFGDVVAAIVTKMVRRHPHVFGSEAGKLTPAQVKGNWGRIKAEEKADRAARRGEDVDAPASLLASVPAGLPALTRAIELQRKASTVGFDWKDDLKAVIAKVHEEADEVAEAIDAGDKTEVENEIGDLMFVVVNLARLTGHDPELALRKANAKFERRFLYIETRLAANGRALTDSSLQEMDALWNEAKRME